MVCLRTLCASTSKSSGAKSKRRQPLNQASSQKSVELPIPTSQQIEVVKKALVTASSCSGKEVHACAMSVLLSQSQRNRNTLPMRFRSRMPRPPRPVGRATLPQVNMHFPPCTTFVPVHKKALKTFTRDFCNHSGKWRLMVV
jgi:hypothetical protein